MELIRYAALGAFNVVLGLVVLVTLVEFAGLPYPLAQVVTHFLVITWAFFPSSRWVFGKRVPLVRGLAAFHLSYVIHVPVAAGGLILLVEGVGLPLVPAQLGSLALAACTSYGLQRRFVYGGAAVSGGVPRPPRVGAPTRLREPAPRPVAMSGRLAPPAR